MMFRVKYCVIILDGASGWPLGSLGGRTTLEVANTPALDRMAADGLLGMAQTVPAGTEPSSAAACMSILGYDPVADRIGRGAIEAASMGIDLEPGQVALRMNLVTIADGTMASYAGGHVSTPESATLVGELAAELQNDSVRLFPGIAYRHIMVVDGRPGLLEARYTPPHDISDQPIEGRRPEGPEADFLRELMERARPVLERSEVNRLRIERGDLPVTDIWPFWPGEAPRGLSPFPEARRVTAAMTSGVDLLNGLAVMAGIDRLDIEGVTDGPDNDYRAQAQGALDALEERDLVVIHVESPDEAGHAGDAQAKQEAIEAIDREVVARVLAAHAEGARVLAMPDHPTPIETKTHAGESVPFALWGPGIGASGAAGFSEETARAAGVMVDPGRGVMDLLLGA
jgi:2,3-bisphosphoglycerate-independent phosphoglycerate mutase